MVYMHVSGGGVKAKFKLKDYVGIFMAYVGETYMNNKKL